MAGFNCRQIGERLQCQGNSLDPVRVQGLDKIGVKVVWHLTLLFMAIPKPVYSMPVIRGFYLQPGQEGERASWTESVWHGASHVLSGLDHILFILTLTLLYRFGIPLLKAVAGFTLDTPLSALASLELVSPPSAAIELLIALSILILVRETLNPETSRLNDSPSLLSCLFGLLHGFGFAGGLVQIGTGLPLNQQLWELLWFNMGVEAAQIAIYRSA